MRGLLVRRPQFRPTSPELCVVMRLQTFVLRWRRAPQPSSGGAKLNKLPSEAGIGDIITDLETLI